MPLLRSAPGELAGHHVEPEPSWHARRPTRYKPGRVCEGCETVLSIYNDGTRCALCEAEHIEALDAAAEAATERPKSRRRSRALTGEAAAARALIMREMRSTGATLADIGFRWGLSVGRVSQILQEGG